ncbi:uncharacterized protein LOC133475719 isoform X4 [Phyllopteryx taeniolatus]|uniref:uncharacterized protein LOC133475719 isoform X4 n=1 Tax=Phyllopteryx taeniolatus TaxID=161469 RepID=UPI002AD357A6|nr:uncharacterized protein LOC133475719 isoform X4 [Phyllopteryx taeniolatus]XP_061624989.1 uncharacterized protein LOC133475719 isoform X4 [Phyllopteryx taeniolatus]
MISGLLWHYVSTFVKTDPPPDKSILSLECLKPAVALRMIEKLHSYAKPVSVKSSRPCKVPVCEVAGSRINSTPVKAASLIPPQDGSNTLPWTLCCPKTTIEEKRKRKSAWLRDDTKSSDMARALPKYEKNEAQRNQLHAYDENYIVYIQGEDIQQLISDEEELPPQSHGGCSTLELEDPLPPHIKEEQKHPQLPHVKDEEDPQFPHMKKEEEDPQLPHIKKEEEDPQLPHIKKEAEDPQLPHIKKEEEDPQFPYIIKEEEDPQLSHSTKEKEDPQLPHVKVEEEYPQLPHSKEEEIDPQLPNIKEEQKHPQPAHIQEEEEDPQPPHIKEKEEEFDVSKLPLTGGSVKSIEEKPPEGSELHHLCASEDHCGGPPPDILMSPLSDSDKVPLTRDKDCKGFIMATRSSRRKPPLQDAKEHAVKALDKTEELEVQFMNSLKGRGVFAKACFQKGDFVVEYRGELINSEESKRRRMTYHKASAVFMFDFCWKGDLWCIDASVYDGSLGRLINADYRHPNCQMKRVTAKDKPHLCLFALRDIQPGEEITCDLGEKAGPQTKQDLDESEVLSSDKVGIIPPPHLVVLSDSNESQNPCTSSSQLNGNSQKTKEQMELDSDKLLDPSLDGSSKEYITKRGENPSSGDGNTSNINVSIDQKRKMQRFPNVENSDGCPSLQERDAALKPTLKRGCSPIRNKSPFGKRERFSVSFPKTDTSSGNATKEIEGGDTGSLSEDSAPDMEEYLPDRSPSLDKVSVDLPCVPAVCKKKDGSRIYNKKQYCLYCKTGFVKISRHLERAHRDKPEVARALSFAKRSKGRSMCLERLRNQGNFTHNVEVLNSGIGTPVPRKRPKDKSQVHNFLHCTFCQGFFLKHALWKHMKFCKFKPSNPPNSGKMRIQALCGFTAPAPPGVKEQLWKLINRMIMDDVYEAVKSDPWIMEYGQHLYNRHGHDATKHEYIRQQMRALGRLLVCSRKNTPMKTIKDHMRPSNFMHVVQAAKDTAGYNCETRTYKSPSLALKIGYSLERISKLVESNANVRRNDSTLKYAKAFRTVYKTRWNEIISSASLKTLKESKWNAPQLLPFTEDVQTLHSFLDTQQQDLFRKLSSESSPMTYAELTKVILTQIILFNRPRAGEVSKIPLSAYLSSTQSDPQEDVNFALSDLEKRLFQHFWRIEIRGKADRKVPVLLTPVMHQTLDLLVRKRNECGILPENTYLFARPSSLICYRGSDTLRNFAKVCGAKRPESLSSKKLHKQMGTLSQVLNLTNPELDQLANFLGHDVTLQQQFYRLPEGILQLAKISKVLMAREQGRLAQFKGKSLDDVNIDPAEDVHMYSDQDRDPEEPGDAEPAYESDSLDIQQLISDEEELPPQLHMGCSSLEHEDPLPPHIKEEQKHPQLPHVKKEEEDSQLPYVKVEEEDPQPPHIKEEAIQRKLPNIKEEQTHPQPADIKENEEDRKNPHVKEKEDPQLPHIKEVEEGFDLSKLPLTGGSVKSKEKPPEGSELHHHSPSVDHCGGPPPDNLMAPLSDSDKVPLTRDKDCKGFIMATRSSRRKPPLQDAQEHAVKALDKTEELEVQFMNSLKGRGVFAKAFFQKGDFVVEYRGELINSEESKRRRMTYHKASAVFMFDFCWKEDLWCIDASVYDGSLGRLVNADDRHPNCQMKRVIAKDKPHLCLFALRDIQPGEEITFDLGEKAGPQSKQDLDEPEVLSSDKVGLIPPPHLVELSDSNESQNPCTSSSQLNGNSQKTKEQMELDSDKLLDPSLDGSSKEYITKRGEDPSSVDTNSSNINVSIDQKRKMQRFPNVENSDECPSLQERDAALKPTLKRGCSPIRNKSASGKRKRCSVSCPKTDTSSGNATKERELGDTGSLSEDSAPDMEEYLPERSPSLDKVSVDFPCVPAVCKKEVGSRIYNKKQYCLYCKTEFVKLSRHLERAHRDKPEVARALSFAKRSKGRSMCLERLRNQSNFPHNFEVLNSGVGTPVSRKRPKDKPSNLPNFGKIRFQPLCGFTAPPPPGVKEQLWKLINSMIMDDVYESVNSDPWIMEYCQYLYNRDRHDATKHECIRQQMRALGRLLVCSRKNTPMKTIKDHMRPSNFMHVVQAAKDTAGYNCETRTYKSPSLALKIGCSLERISKLVESNANVRRNDSTLKYAKAFRTVYKTRWNELISSASLKTLNSSKCNAPQLLPFTKDVQTLHSFLDTQQQDLFRKLSSESSPMTYAELTKVILTQIILFNRPRAGEVSKIPLSAHLSSTQSDPQEDVNFALSDLEKRLFQHFWRIEISGQADRNVPVLLTPVMHQTLDLLVRKRNECGILPENTYLFARPSSLICYRGSDTLRNFAKVCGAKRPESLSSKKLHKQMGTLSQVLNLTNPELDQLANFLGHDVTLQQQFYRLPEGILQLAKISEVLMAREQGRLAQFKGKSLDDVNIDPAEDVHMYSDQDRDPEEPGDAEPAYESDTLDIQQLISDEEELHPLHGGCSSLEHEDPLPPRIKEEQKHPQLPHIKEEEDPQLPHVKKEQEDPQLSYVKVEEEDPQPPHVEEEEIDPKLPNIKEEQKHPQPAHIHEEEEDPKLPHVKEEEEELGVSKLPLTGGSVKCKQEKPLEGSELHHHSPSKDHCGGPPPDNLMAPLSDSDKVSLTRDKDCKGFIMATRSSRRKPPLQDAQEHAVKALDKTEELEVQFMNSLKGRGVFAKAFFRKGDFVVEYRGELINSEESKRRRMTYHKASAVFMFDFCWKEDLWCIDASVYDGSLGRLVNADDRHPNCQMKRVIAKDKPHLCLFALRDIQPGEEITFDLGEKAGPQSKQDLDEPEVLSSDKVGLIPPPHLVELSDSNESQNPCTSSSQLNGNSQKTKEQMELDSDKLLDPSLDGSSKEYITKRGEDPSSVDTNSSNINVSIDQKRKMQRFPNVENSDECPSLQERDAALKPTLKRGCSPIRNKSASGKRKRCSVSCPKTDTSSGNATKERELGDTGSLSEDSAPDMEEYLPERSPSLDKVSVDFPCVPAVCKKEVGSRIYNKKQYCLYCKTEFVKLSRHLERAHRDKPEVARALSFAKRSKGRSMCLERLRNQSNFPHNFEVLNSGVGTPVSRKRPKDKPSNLPNFGKIRFQPLCGFTAPPPPGVKEQLWKLINSMIMDDVYESVNSDPWIMEYCQYLYNRDRHDATKHECIRQQMRALGRLLVCSRKNTPMKTIKDHMRPSNFMHVVQAAKDTAGYNCETRTYKSPSLALKIGCSLERISKLVESNANVRRNDSTLKYAKAFRTVYKTRWNELISSASLKTLNSSKCNAPQLLPFTKDVQTLHSFLDTQQQDLFRKLSSESSPMTYAELTKVILTQIILFNRPRAGEVSKIPLSAHLSSTQSDPQEDVNFALSDLEKRLFQHFWRIEISGQADRNVPVLLTPVMHQTLDLLVRKRNECGILPENTYLFARPSSLICYRGSDTLRNFAKVCGAKRPESLSSKKLHKQMGTLSQVLNLTNPELDQLANFLGHDVTLQQQFYRLPEGILQLAKISEVLMAREQGRLAQFKGKSLDDVNIDPAEDVHMYSDQDRDPEEPGDAEPAYESDSLDIQQLISDEEELHPLHGGCSSLEHEDPLPPRIKEEQKHPQLPHIKEEEDPQLPHVKKEQEDPQLSYVKVEEEDPQPPHVEEEEIDPKLPNIKEEQKHPQPAHIHEEEEDPKLPHVKEEEEELGVSKLPLTGGSVKSKQEKPLEGSELHHHSPSKDHCGGPPPDNLMAPLSDSDKVSLTRDKDCKGFIMATRSSRRKPPLQDAQEHAVKALDKTEELEVQFMNSLKGRGVFTKAFFRKGDFVVEYRGELINSEESKWRRMTYHKASAVFMFDFCWKGDLWCIDASVYDGSLGRLVNADYKHPNCQMKRVIAKDKPHLCLFALRDIQPGEEITCDFGGKAGPQTKQDLDEPEVLSSDKVGIIPPPHLVELSDSNESQNPCTSSSQLNGNSQKTKEQMELDSDKLLDPSLDGSSKEYITKHDIQQLISDEEELHLQLHGGCSSLELEDPLPPHIKEEQMHPQLPPVKEEEDPQLPHVKKEEEDPQLLYVKVEEEDPHIEEEIDPKLPNIKEEQKHPQPAHIQEEEEDPQLPHVKEEEEEFDVSKLPLTGVSVKSKEEKPLEGSELHHHSPSEDHCGGPPPDNLMAPLSDSDKVPLTRDIDCKDIQQLISDEEEVPPQLHEGCSSLEHEDPLPPHIKEEQKHPQLPHVKEEDSQLPDVKKEEEDPQLAYVKVEEEPPHIKEEQKHPQPPHIQEEEEDPKLPHVKEEEEEFGVSKLPLTGGSVKSKEEKPPEGSELHHHGPSEDHYGGPPPDNLMAPLSDSDKVPLSRDKDCKDIQQLISDDEVLPLQLHEGCSSLEHEDPLPPHIKEEQKHPQLPHVKEEEDSQLPNVKKEEEDPQLAYVKVEEEPPHIKEEEIDPKLPHIKEEQKYPQPPHIQEEEEDPQLPHVKEEEEEFGVSKLPLTGGSVKSKEEKPPEGSELHHHSQSEDHCGAPPPDNLMASLSDSDKVHLTRDKDCKGFIMATRSSRGKPPLQDAKEHAVKALDKTAELEVQFMNSLKGRGVFTKAFFRKGDFVVEYRGELINSEESKRRRMTYHKASAVFMFDFCWKGDLWCIDASVYDGSLGRLVNADDRHPNCQMKRVIAKDKPHLCLFALRDIQPGEEITFDLGEKAGPQSKQDFDEPEVLSSDKVGIIPPPHLVTLSDSNESQNPCTSSSQLNGNSQKTKEQMELDSDKLLDPSLDGSSKEYITKHVNPAGHNKALCVTSKFQESSQTSKDKSATALQE